uniref:short transient receptor potential channel 4-like n=1 Tax=Ciona intestinalis TaxID=7719 RepID=UPI00089DB829|nr:short transient receptor potential channel 4-like [Ciona intestinalis]|eukprot:XP_018669251.1 short transient receptor potential channel 4-like [Ciona intestinalis]
MVAMDRSEDEVMFKRNTVNSVSGGIDKLYRKAGMKKNKAIHKPTSGDGLHMVEISERRLTKPALFDNVDGLIAPRREMRDDNQEVQRPEWDESPKIECVKGRTASDAVSRHALDNAKTRLKPIRISKSSDDIVNWVKHAQKKASGAKPSSSKRNHKFLKRLQSSNRNVVSDGWKVRNALASLTPPQTINSYYLEAVGRGNLREVIALFAIVRGDRIREFKKDCVDQNERSALRTAVENKNIPMCEFLVNNKVAYGDCLFHAIKIGFLPTVEVLLENHRSVNAIIKGDNPYFTSGTTPMLLAASLNQYEIIKILFKSGHSEIKNDVQEGDCFHTEFESATKLQMCCSAKSSPAYITIICEMTNTDPVEYCIDHIKDLRTQANVEYEYADFYKQLERKTEDYMCSLLDQIRSSQELGDLFMYNYDFAGADKWSIPVPTSNFRKLGCRMELLDDANAHRLVKVVTHHYSQLALAYMRYKNTPFLKDSSTIRNYTLRTLLGIIFPILSLIYTVAPNTRFGRLIASPVVSFDCHMASDVAFVILVFINSIHKDIDRNYLGSSPTVIEWLAVFWIAGKWVQEFEECYHRGMKGYLRDRWNHTDLLALCLLSVAVVFRCLDYSRAESYVPLYLGNGTTTHLGPFEPRMIADGFLAWAYVFVFLRLLSLTRANRRLGPLQVTLSRMMGDVLRFMIIFCLVVFSFALGLSELYWVYGTPKGKQMLCSYGANGTDVAAEAACLKSTIIFGGMWSTTKSLFWSLFGHIDITQLSLSNKHGFTETMGRFLLAVYHAIAIIVILNMLIAMMSKSYEITSENEEREWKFHRTAMWIRFIRREAIRPPPMNLIPHPHVVCKVMLRFLQLILRRRSLPQHHPKNGFGCSGLSITKESELYRLKVRCKLIKRKLIRRNKFKVLLSNGET